MDGGAGNDTIYGGAGNDTYIVNLGSGNDTIIDSSGTDEINFGSSLTEDDIAFFMSGNDLKIGFVDDSGDLITVINQGLSGNQLERLELSDGQYLTDSEVNQVIQDMATYATAHGISFNNIDDVKGNADLMNIVAGAWHA